MPLFRTLLLARSQERRRAALEQFQKLYEQVSDDVLAEVTSNGEELDGKPLLQRLRLRPWFGYKSACAALYRTMVQYVLPEQAGSNVAVQRQTNNDGVERVRYTLKDDILDGEQREASGEEAQADAAAATGNVGSARALFVLLRQLAGTTAWELEGAAAEAAAEEALPTTGMQTPARWLQRTPDLETPDYDVLYMDPSGVFEVRKYAPYSVVQTEMGQSGNGTGAFFRLAGYIFGKSNTAGEKMAMTTPVQSDVSGSTMSFIMPRRFWTEGDLQGAPVPVEGAGVTLSPVPEETVAVTVFGGYGKRKMVSEKTAQLLDALKREGDKVEVLDDTEPRLLQYNDPFTVPWKRRNEVILPVRWRS